MVTSHVSIMTDLFKDFFFFNTNGLDGEYIMFAFFKYFVFKAIHRYCMRCPPIQGIIFRLQWISFTSIPHALPNKHWPENSMLWMIVLF